MSNNHASQIIIDKDTHYPLHKNISVTFFWVGEEASAANGYINNKESVWDSNWVAHFGGIDTPDNREGFLPAGFVPSENPFYFALPYDDFSESRRKPTAFNTVYWSNRKNTWESRESMCKNRWIKIIKGEKIAYAQWQDAGPFGVDDSAYVFGADRPKNRVNRRAGLDVSPAVRDYLGLSDIDVVDWAFVDDERVPPGPWKQIITTSQIDWN